METFSKSLYIEMHKGVIKYMQILCNPMIMVISSWLQNTQIHL